MNFIMESTKYEADFLNILYLRNKQIFSKEEFESFFWKKIYQKRKTLKSLLEKKRILPLKQWLYIVNDWFLVYEKIINFFCGNKWYIWWTRVANMYFWYEQLEQKLVIYNEKISERKIIGGKEFVFIKKQLSNVKTFQDKKSKLKYSSKEQSFVDFMLSPWFIGWDYDVLEQCLNERKVDVSKIESIIKSMKNNSLYIRFLYMLYKCWYNLNEDLTKYKTTRYIPYIIWNKNQKRKIKDFNLLGY